jgi:hypothetical protein
MHLEASRVDHDRRPVRALRSQSHHNPGEDIPIASPLPTGLERLGWAKFLWCIALDQSIDII